MPISSGSRRNWNCCEWPGSSTKRGSKKIMALGKPTGGATPAKEISSDNSPLFDRGRLELLSNALRALSKGFASLPEFESDAPGLSRMEEVLTATATRLQDNYPYFHPMYAGQMLKPAHPVAQLAYALAMTINPNNHALDGGRATSAMEKEAVAQIAAMFGWSDALGHLSGGGTMANLEALWVAGQLR